MTDKKQLSHKIILLCERLDIAQFISVYIEHLRKRKLHIPAVKIINLGGIGKMTAVLAAITRQPWFSEVEKVILFADATNKRQNREHELYRAQLHSFLKQFACYSYFLFPHKTAAGRWQAGFLEDVLLAVLKMETSECCNYYNLKNMTDDFLLSVNNARGKEHHLVNYSRHFLCTYLAGTSKYAGLRLAEAAQKGAFDLESGKFKDLREVLMEL